MESQVKVTEGTLVMEDQGANAMQDRDVMGMEA